MRAVFTTASPLAVATARMLVGQGHNVIIIEKDEGLIEELTDQLDCGFLHGDGSRPATLEEVGPGQEDLLFCLGPSDQENIIASLVGRELGFGRVVTKIEDTDFENICVALALQDTVVPQHETAKRLADIVNGLDSPNLSAILRGGVRIYSFVVRESLRGRLSELPLPEDAMPIAISRGEETLVARGDPLLKEGDHVAILSPAENLDRLREVFGE